MEIDKTLLGISIVAALFILFAGPWIRNRGLSDLATYRQLSKILLLGLALLMMLYVPYKSDVGYGRIVTKRTLLFFSTTDGTVDTPAWAVQVANQYGNRNCAMWFFRSTKD